MSNNSIPGRQKKRQTSTKPKSIQLKYEANQWSPINPTGQKFYKRKQLLTLRCVAESQAIPKLKPQCSSLMQINLMPTFAKTMQRQQQQQQQHHNPSKKRPVPSENEKQKSDDKESKGNMVHINLALSNDIKLRHSDNAWKPKFLMAKSTDDDDSSRTATLYKKIRGILNKLTFENLNSLLDEIEKQNIDSVEKLNGVMLLVFEKAVDEPKFSEAYAKLCQRLAQHYFGVENAKFKTTLITKCQYEFEKNVVEGIAAKLVPMRAQMIECDDPYRKMEFKAQLMDEEQKLRQRSVCTVRFIGELYKKNMLTSRIMDWCIISLLDSRSEEKLECLCKLLTTIGEKLEIGESGERESSKTSDLSTYFGQMQQIADKRINATISNRTKFMLQDVIDLRKNAWKAKRK